MVFNKYAEEVTISGQKYYAPGASAKLAAKVTPADAARKTVTWSLENASKGITINASNGTVSFAKDVAAGAKATVVATVAGVTTVTGKYEVSLIAAEKKAKTLSLGLANDTKSAANSATIATVAKGSLKNTTTLKASADNGMQVAFTSSNEKICTVSTTDGKTATVKATGKGSCTVTATTLDGSNKKATYKINVIQPADSIKVTGQSNIVVGNKASYKAAVLPAAASNKNVVWSLDTDKKDITVDAKGNVTVGSSVAAGTTFKVVATAADGSAVKGTFGVTVTSVKTTGINMAVSGTANEKVNAPATKSGSLTSLRLYNVDIPGNSVEENKITLKRTGVGNANVAVSWTNSNAKVADIKDNGNGTVTIVAKAAGTTNISCTAMDGSNKKATTKITVITPASAIDINPPKGTSSSRSGNMDMTILALGAGCTSKAALSSTYGKPSVSKVAWDYEIGVYDNSSGTLKFKLADEVKAPI